MLNVFHIIIPVYNAKAFIGKCLDSCLNQSYPAAHIVVVDDGSTDGTTDIVKEYAANNPKITPIIRQINEGSPLASVVRASNLLSILWAAPNDIYVNVDGDDWLASEDSLKIVNSYYDSDNVWLTYGSFKALSGKPYGVNQPVKDTARYRKHERWKTSHLRTYRKHLWDRIKDEDLRDVNGEYYRYSCEFTYMFPMVEMAGIDRIKQIKERIYVYNDTSPLNLFRIAKEEVRRQTDIIRAKDEYQKA